MMKKRIRLALLVFCMALAILPSTAWAEELEEVESSVDEIVMEQDILAENPEPVVQATTPKSGTCGNNLTWILENGTLTISGSGEIKDYDGYRECAPWYTDRNSITAVELKMGVTSIGNNAFSNCSSLTSVTIPDSVTSIGNNAFYLCTNLTSVTVPDNVTSIGEYTFGNCSSLTSVTIPNSVTSIGAYAFVYCSSLTSMTIPDSVTSIEDATFWNCSILTSVTIPDSVTSIGVFAFAHCSGLASVTIPDSVTSIGNAAFGNCSSLTNVTIPDSVTSIGNNAFEKCSSLTNVIIPDSVTSIGNATFWNCSSLTSVTIPDSVTSIENNAFSNCSSLTNVIIPDSVTSIENNAFSNCSSLISVTIPDSITSIGDYAFFKCGNLTDVYYSGTKEQWEQITISYGNDPLLDAILHYATVSGDTAAQALVDETRKYVGFSRENFSAEDRKKLTDGGWCADFIKLCAEKVGVKSAFDTSSGYAVSLYNAVINHGGRGVRFVSSADSIKQAPLVQRGDYTPQVGDVVLIDWYSSSKMYDHAGIVYAVNTNNHTFTMIDGNAGSGIVKMREVSYTSNDILSKNGRILGFASPNWTAATVYGTRTDVYHCPIDVTYTYNNEVLDSASEILNASFGSMEIGTDDSIIVTLNGYYDVDIEITGTGVGTMDLTSTFRNEDGTSSTRTFSNVPINTDTIGKVRVCDSAAEAVLELYRGETFTEAWVAEINETVSAANEDITHWYIQGDPVEDENSAPGDKGDVTGDGDVSIGDVVKLARAVAGYITLTDEERELGDVTGDGDISIGDVVKLARFVAGYITTLQ